MLIKIVSVAVGDLAEGIELAELSAYKSCGIPVSKESVEDIGVICILNDTVKIYLIALGYNGIAKVLEIPSGSE